MSIVENSVDIVDYFNPKNRKSSIFRLFIVENPVDIVENPTS